MKIIEVVDTQVLQELVEPDSWLAHLAQQVELLVVESDPELAHLAQQADPSAGQAYLKVLERDILLEV